MILENKNQLRKQMKNTLTQYFSSEDIKTISQKTCEKLLQSDFYKNAEIILSFVTGKLEIETSVINEKTLELGKTLAVPKVISETEMEFFVLDSKKTIESQIETGAFGIGEPKASLEKFDLNTIKGKSVLLVVPGIAFTKEGKRCGHGKGYYDRFIPKLIQSECKIKTVGICLPCQIVDDLPTDEFDSLIDSVLF